MSENNIDINGLINLYKETFERQKEEGKKFCSQWFNDLSQQEKNNFRNLHEETNKQVAVLGKLLYEYTKDNPNYDGNTEILQMLDDAFPEQPFEPSYTYVFLVFFSSETDKSTKICKKGKMWQVFGRKLAPYWCFQAFINNQGYDENIYEHIGKFKVLAFFKDEATMTKFNDIQYLENMKKIINN